MVVFFLMEKPFTNIICVMFVVDSLVVTCRLFHIDCNISFLFFCWCVLHRMYWCGWSGTTVLDDLRCATSAVHKNVVLGLYCYTSRIRMGQAWSGFADLPCELFLTTRGYMFCKILSDISVVAGLGHHPHSIWELGVVGCRGKRLSSDVCRFVG